MCKSSKLFLSCFMFSLLSVSPFVSASDNTVVAKVEKNSKSDVKAKGSNAKSNKNSESDVKEEDDFDISSLSGSHIHDMLYPYYQELEDFFSTIFDLKNKLKSQSDKAKLILNYLESCKYVFEQEQNCFMVSVYPKNIDSSNCSLEKVAVFNLDSNSKIAFNLARNKSDKIDNENNSEDDKKKKDFDFSSLSKEKIKEMGKPYANVIRMLFGIINEFKNGIIKESKKNKQIMNYLASCKFVLEKNSSSDKSDSFDLNIYSCDGSDAVVERVGTIKLGENSSINCNFIKKQTKNTK